jgi:hypothetical protein
MMMKKSMFVFTLAILIGTIASAQDFALGQKIDLSLFTKTNEKLTDSNQTRYRMISPENSRFAAENWDEIFVNALPDGTITVINYSKGISENELPSTLLLFIFYIQSTTEYTEEKNIEIGNIFIPRFLKPGTNEGILIMGGKNKGKDEINIVFRIDAGNYERTFAQAIKDAESRSSSTPASPPRQSGGSMSAAEDPPSSGASTSSGSYRSSGSSVDFGFTFHFNVYLHGWHQNLVSFGIPLQLGVELELPVVTLDLLGEASGGMGYGNLFEYHLGGILELYFFKKVGLGAGAGFYGNTMNLAIGAGDSEEDPISYAPRS